MTPLFLDNHLVAFDKPGGLLTQPSGTDDESLEEQARDFIKREFNKPGNVFLEAVHRIDRPACGIVLFARTSKGLARMNDAMRQNACRKTYRAIVRGRLQKTQGTLEDWLVHDDFHAAVTAPHAPGAKLCRLTYRTIQSLTGGLTLLEIDLQTGRYHQIRAQLAHQGCPIVGDVKYGDSTPCPRGAVALQHFQLETPHPTQPQTLVIQSKINLISLFT